MLFTWIGEENFKVGMNRWAYTALPSWIIICRYGLPPLPTPNKRANALKKSKHIHMHAIH
jgi:hypothetical protein